jgi:hypothetical protein
LTMKSKQEAHTRRRASKMKTKQKSSAANFRLDELQVSSGQLGSRRIVNSFQTVMVHCTNWLRTSLRCRIGRNIAECGDTLLFLTTANKNVPTSRLPGSSRFVFIQRACVIWQLPLSLLQSAPPLSIGLNFPLPSVYLCTNMLNPFMHFIVNKICLVNNSACLEGKR